MNTYNIEHRKDPKRYPLYAHLTPKEEQKEKIGTVIMETGLIVAVIIVIIFLGAWLQSTMPGK